MGTRQLTGRRCSSLVLFKPLSCCRECPENSQSWYFLANADRNALNRESAPSPINFPRQGRGSQAAEG